MKTKLNLDRIIEEHSHDQYCPYCVKPRNGKPECCGEMDFILFSNLDTHSQLKTAAEIAKEGG